MLAHIAWLVIGLVVVSIGADVLIRGAARGAARLGVPPLVVGLTVVAFGTSAPELAISFFALGQNQADLALGNIVGSNIFNVLFILGLSSLVRPLAVARRLVRVDVPLLIGLSAAVTAMSHDGSIGRVDGALLVAALVAYVWLTIRTCRGEQGSVKTEYEGKYGPAKRGLLTSLAFDGALVIVGLALLTLGARWLVGGAAGLARAAGVSELVVGLTIVAAGTSVPEVATSVVASVRGERDIAVGNALGSCLFNLLCVLGLTALISPTPVPVQLSVLRFDLPVMIATAIVCLPILFTGFEIRRWEGALLLGYYVAYVAFLVVDASWHEGAAAFGTVMLFFVMPLTAVTLGLLAWRAAARRREARG